MSEEYFLIKNGWYYRPKACGYTDDPREAGVFGKEYALSHSKSCFEVKAVLVSERFAESKPLSYKELEAKVKELEKQNDLGEVCYRELNKHFEQSCRERDALKAELAEYKKTNEWQPIETAPRDGDILLHVESAKESFVAFLGTDPTDGDKQWVFARDGKGTSFIVRSPTHWQPLPTPPEEDSEL